jgi:HAD superfamily phosphatase (TIGR01668 family)
VLYLIKKLLPDEHVKSVFNINPETLKQRGIKGIITDLDNTLVEWDRPNASPELIDWLKKLKESGLQVTVVSNNNENRVKLFSVPLGIPFIHSARKPLKHAFKRAAKDMGLNKKEVVVIGDQIFTDVLGGNSIGLHTILVVPVAQTDGIITKFNRRMERHILTWMRNKGMINWEE